MHLSSSLSSAILVGTCGVRVASRELRDFNSFRRVLAMYIMRGGGDARSSGWGHAGHALAYPSSEGGGAREALHRPGNSNTLLLRTASSPREQRKDAWQHVHHFSENPPIDIKAYGTDNTTQNNTTLVLLYCTRHPRSMRRASQNPTGSGRAEAVPLGSAQQLTEEVFERVCRGWWVVVRVTSRSWAGHTERGVMFDVRCSR